MTPSQERALREIAKECYVNATEHGFHHTITPVPQSLMLIVSEAAEALEKYRDDVFDVTIEKDGISKPDGVASELADVVIRALDSLVEYFGPDRAAGVIAEKMAYNKTRPVGHGGVRL